MTMTVSFHVMLLKIVFFRLSYKVMDFITNVSLYSVPIHWLSLLPVLVPSLLLKALFLKSKFMYQ